MINHLAATDALQDPNRTGRILLTSFSASRTQKIEHKCPGGDEARSTITTYKPEERFWLQETQTSDVGGYPISTSVDYMTSSGRQCGPDGRSFQYKEAELDFFNIPEVLTTTSPSIEMAALMSPGKLIYEAGLGEFWEYSAPPSERRVFFSGSPSDAQIDSIKIILKESELWIVNGRLMRRNGLGER